MNGPAEDDQQFEIVTDDRLRNRPIGYLSFSHKDSGFICPVRSATCEYAQRYSEVLGQCHFGHVKLAKATKLRAQGRSVSLRMT